MSICKEVMLLLFLAVYAYQDEKEHMLSLWLLLAGALSGTSWLLKETLPLGSVIGAGSVGIAFLLLAFLSRETLVGIGDGCLLIVTGLYLGALYQILLLVISLFVMGMAAVLLLLKHVRKTHPIPYAPALLTGYVGLLFLYGGRL